MNHENYIKERKKLLKELAGIILELSELNSKKRALKKEMFNLDKALLAEEGICYNKYKK